MSKRFRRVLWSSALCVLGSAVVSFPMTGWPGIFTALFSLVCLQLYFPVQRQPQGGSRRRHRTRGN